MSLVCRAAPPGTNSTLYKHMDIPCQIIQIAFVDMLEVRGSSVFSDLQKKVTFVTQNTKFVDKKKGFMSVRRNKKNEMRVMVVAKRKDLQT